MEVDLYFTHFFISVYRDDCTLRYLLHCFIRHKGDMSYVGLSLKLLISSGLTTRC